MHWLTITRTYEVLTTLVVLVYVLVFIGFFAAVPSYVEWLSWLMNVAVSVVLISMFHPLRSKRHVLSVGDDAIIFGAATILFTDVVLKSAMRNPTVAGWLRSAKTSVAKVSGEEVAAAAAE